VNGTFNCTVSVFTIAATNRISPPLLTACPAESPCGAANASLPFPVVLAAVPPAK
jgi:hypothetical protein